ncbi:MAG: type II secretion system protein GspM [Pseudomonadota bacterium]
MRDLLDNLSERERVLVMVAAGLLVVVIVLFGIINPVHSYRDNARQRFVEAERMSALSGKIAQASQQTQQSSGSLRSLVTQRARQRDLVIARIADADDSVDLVFSDEPYDAFFDWLQALTEEDGLIVQEALVRPGSGPGSVNVRMTLAR